MQTTFALTAPVSVGGVSNPLTISSLKLTGFGLTTTPSLAPLGTGVLSLILTDPVSGYQETVNYADASVVALWEQLGEAIAAAVFSKLLADTRIPAGAITTDAPPATPTLT